MIEKPCPCCGGNPEECGCAGTCPYVSGYCILHCPFCGSGTHKDS